MPAPTITRAQRDALRQVMGRVQERMRALDLSGNQFADALGTSGSAVSDWFTKGRVPLVHQFLQMPRILLCDGHWLMTGEGDWHRRHANEAPDEAAIRGGLAVIAQVDGAVSEIRNRLVAQHEKANRALQAARLAAGDKVGVRRGRPA